MTWAVAVTGHWDGHLIEFVRQFVAPNSLVLDVGASLGLWTVPLARAAGSVGAKVWAFEPHPLNQAWLLRNVEMNGLAHVVEIRPIALGASDDRARMVLCEPHGGNAAMALDTTDPAVEVSVARLDALPRAARVSFLKLDVEGFELQVLRGARRMLSEDRPVILGEFSQRWLKARGEDLASFLDELCADGYDVYSVDRSRSAWWRSKDRVCLRRLHRPYYDLPEDLLLQPRAAV